MAPPIDHPGIILRKMCFGKGVNPNCSANYVQFLMNLDHVLDNPRGKTWSAYKEFTHVLQGATLYCIIMKGFIVYPNGAPKWPSGASV